MLKEVLQNNPFVIAGHRGYRTCYPENTLLAYHEALVRGVDMLEVDLQLTKDNHVVMIHDLTVDRTTTSTGAVKDYTLAEIKEMDAGFKAGIQFEGVKIPTLREFFDYCLAYPNVTFNIEIKDRTFACVDETMKLCMEYNVIPRAVFTCFDATIVAYMKDKYGVMTQGFPKQKMFNFVEGPDGTYSKLDAVGISMDLLNPQIVQEFQKMNILAWCYAPDTQEEVQYSLDCGATLATVNNVMPALTIARKKGLR